MIDKDALARRYVDYKINTIMDLIMDNEQIHEINKQWHERQDKLEDEVMGLFDFCRCGNPHIFIEGLRQYLTLVKFAHDDRIPEEYRDENLQNDYYVPYMYLADKAELTEHGGSVFSAWLTDKGKDLLKRLNVSFIDFVAEVRAKNADI